MPLSIISIKILWLMFLVFTVISGQFSLYFIALSKILTKTFIKCVSFPITFEFSAFFSDFIKLSLLAILPPLSVRVAPLESHPLFSKINS